MLGYGILLKKKNMQSYIILIHLLITQEINIVIFGLNSIRFDPMANKKKICLCACVCVCFRNNTKAVNIRSECSWVDLLHADLAVSAVGINIQQIPLLLITCVSTDHIAAQFEISISISSFLK